MKPNETIEIVESAPARSEAQLAKLERDLGTKLPKPYRDFLAKHNGGTPRPVREMTSYEVLATSCLGLPASVYGKAKAKPRVGDFYGDNEAPTSIGQIKDFLPNDPGGKDSVRIGLTLSGKQVRLVIRGKACGNVGIFDVTTFDAEENDPAEHLVPLTDSFGEFVEAFSPDLSNSGPDLTDDDLAACERAISMRKGPGAELSRSYKDFMRKTNGGLVSHGKVHRWTVAGKQHVEELERLYWVRGGARKGPKDLRAQAKVYKGRIPADTLAIAEDDGNLFLIGIKGKNLGKVFFWSHHEEAGTPAGKKGGPTYDNVTLVADDFDAFIEGLRVTEA